MNRSLLIMILIGVSLSTQVWSQQEQKQQSVFYDVVSIRVVQQDRDDMSFHEESDGFIAKNVGVEQLLSRAYLFRADLISGIPDSLQKETFDITAKVTGATPTDLPNMSYTQRSQALLQILETRFNLKAHTATKPRAGFDLLKIRDAQPFEKAAAASRSQSGLKTEPYAPSGALSQSNSKGTTTLFTKVSMDGLAAFISFALQRTTLNKTDVTGTFDFALMWLPPDRLLEEHPDIIYDPPLALALKKQLGLELRAVTVPTPTLIVDQITEPTPN